MHVVTNRRTYKGKVYESHLLRHSFREDGKVKNETLANLSHLPGPIIEVLRQLLAGKYFVLAGEGFEIQRTLLHGHVAALSAMANKLGMAKLLGPSSKERDIALSLIIARAIKPTSKLATTRWWGDTTLGADLVPEGTSTDEVYRAMDWLVGRQSSIEAALARRHLEKGSMVLYDLSSSWMEGTKCPLSHHGYSRDHKSSKTQIEYGLMTDKEGRPISIEVFGGNTADPKAFVSAVSKVRERFGLKEVVMVGDRGMITSARIEALQTLGGTSWITCLRAPAIKALAEDGAIQLSLFDEMNLVEITHPDYPNERLVACRNPSLASERTRKRNALLEATEEDLKKIQDAISRPIRPLHTKEQILLRVAKVINRHKMAKHFDYTVTDESLEFSKKTDQIAAEEALDGIYVIRTPVPADQLDTAQVVHAHKGLKVVEADFRSLKAIDLDLRPIHHYLEDRVRAHVFIAMLASYLLWHLRKAWAPLCFVDEEQLTPVDPVAPAVASASARAKAATKVTTDKKYPAQNMDTLLHHLSTLARNTIVFSNGVRIEKLTVPTELQRQAFALIEAPIPIEIRAM